MIGSKSNLQWEKNCKCLVVGTVQKSNLLTSSFAQGEGLGHKHENGRTKIFAMSFNHKYRVKKETKSLDIQIKEPRSCLLASNLYMDKDGTFEKVQMSVTHTTMRRKTKLVIGSLRCSFLVLYWISGIKKNSLLYTKSIWCNEEKRHLYNFNIVCLNISCFFLFFS